MVRWLVSLTVCPQETRCSSELQGMYSLAHPSVRIVNVAQTLNLIGFQKVLKKWEKVTHMAIRDAYLKEKVTTTRFFSWIS